MARLRFRAAWSTAARLKALVRKGSKGKGDGILADVFGEDPLFFLEQGGLNIYQGFRHQEPNLVSIVDGKPEMAKALDALVLHMNGHPVGAVSYLVQTNTRKTPPGNRYGRIDIVIVPASSRGTGLGRLLLLCANLVLLRNHGPSLYSISCLAAHPAVAVVLESVGYTPEHRENSDFVHEELRLEGQDHHSIERDFTGYLGRSFQAVRYGLRQRTVNA